MTAHASDSHSQERPIGELATVRGKRCENQRRFRRGLAKVVHQQNAAVRLRVAVDQHADIVVLGDKDSSLGGGFGQ